MAESNFVVKNGLVVNTYFTANSILLQANGLTVNSSTGTFSGNIVGTLTTTSQPYITANNTNFVGSTSAANVVSNSQLQANLANYQTTAGLSANVATLTANNSTRLNGQLASYYTSASNITTGTLPWAQAPTNTVNTTGAFTFTGMHTYTNGISFSNTITANGSNGAAGQVLTSSGASGNVYWSTVSGGGGGTVTSVGSGNGLTGGPVTTTGSLSVLANTGIVANSSGLFVNTATPFTFTSNISFNSNTYFGGANNYFQGNVTANGLVQILTGPSTGTPGIGEGAELQLMANDNVTVGVDLDVYSRDAQNANAAATVGRLFQYGDACNNGIIEIGQLLTGTTNGTVRIYTGNYKLTASFRTDNVYFNSNTLTIGTATLFNSSNATFNTNTYFGGANNYFQGNVTINSNTLTIGTASYFVPNGSFLFSQNSTDTPGYGTGSAVNGGAWQYNNLGGTLYLSKSQFAPLRISQRTSSDNFTDFLYNGTTAVGAITLNGTTGTLYTTASDYRLKQDLEPISNAVNSVLSTPVYKFRFISAPTAPKTSGFIAHEAQLTVPEAVNGEKDGARMQSMDYSMMVPVLWAAVQELTARVIDLETRLNT